MKKTVCILTVLVLTGTFLPVSAAAVNSRTAFSDLLGRKPADTFEIITEDKAAFPGQVGAITTSALQGLAVTCEDKDAVIASGIGNYPVIWSDGKWGSTDIPAGQCRMQPVTGFAEQYGKTNEYEYVSGAEYMSYSIADELTDADDPVYLLTVPPVLTQNEAGTYWSADYDALLDAVLADEDLTLRGAVYGTQTSATIYQNGQRAVIRLSDGTDQIPEELTACGEVSSYYGGYYLLDTHKHADFEETLSLCEQLMQTDGIAFAYPAGIVPESVADSVTGFGIELLAYTPDAANDRASQLEAYIIEHELPVLYTSRDMHYPTRDFLTVICAEEHADAVRTELADYVKNTLKYTYWNDVFVVQTEKDIQLEAALHTFIADRKICATVTLDSLYNNMIEVYFNVQGYDSKTDSFRGMDELKAYLKTLNVGIADEDDGEYDQKIMLMWEEGILGITPQPLRGDIDNDGKVSAYDAQLVLRNALDLMLDADTEPLTGADIDGDGGITALDAQYILMFYLENTIMEEPTMWKDLIL